MLEKTITANNKVRLNPQYVLISGVDANNVPRLFRTKPDGTLALGGLTLPDWDEFSLDYYATPLKTNLKTVIYLVGVPLGVPLEVARIELTYVGGGLVENDVLVGGVLTIVP